MEGNKIVLGYWKIRGLVEQIVLLLEVLGVDYELKQYTQGDGPEFDRSEWLDVKFTLGYEFPNLPYLQDGDLKLTETSAIMSYLCDKYNSDLLGKTVEDRAITNMVFNIVQNAKNKITGPCYGGSDKSQVLEAAVTHFEPLVKFIGDKKFLTGDNYTWVDLYWFETVELADKVSEGKIFETYPALKEYQTRVYEIEAVKAYRTGPKWENLIFNNKIATINARGE